MRRRVNAASLTAHKTHRARHSRRCIDARHHDAISSALPALPPVNESWHIIAGNTPLWLAIPRLIELSRQPIAELKISTPGFGRDFAEWLLAAAARRDIADNFGIVCSHYFRSTSEREYDLLAHLAGSRLAVVRCHAKIVAATMQDGAAYAIEGSGNLRSCRSIEQMTITRDAELTHFHQHWITDLIHGTPPDTALRPIGDDEPAGRCPRPAARRHD